MMEGKKWLSPPHEFWLDPRLVSEGVWPKAMVCPGLCGVRLGRLLSGLQGEGFACMGLENICSEWRRLRGLGGVLSLRGHIHPALRGQGWGGRKDLGVGEAQMVQGGFL